MGERRRNRARERLDLLAEGSLDAEEARREAIEVLRGAVGFERWCWPLTDPLSGLSLGGIGEVDFWAKLPRLLALETHGDLTGKPQLVVGRQAAVALSAATGGDLARSRRWRECLDPYGIGDELMAACRDRNGCWASVELMRDAGDAPFDERDALLLHELAPTLGRLVRRSLRQGWGAGGPGTPRPPVTLILDAGLRTVGWTAPLGERLAGLPLIDAEGGGEPLPTAVYEIAARSLAPPGTAVELPNRVRVPTGEGDWAVIEGAPLRGEEAGRVAITVRDAGAGEILDLLCRAHDLSARERQLTELLCAGLATKQLAEALWISSYTVQDHLKSIFAKTGVRSRRELVARLTGRPTPEPSAPSAARPTGVAGPTESELGIGSNGGE